MHLQRVQVPDFRVLKDIDISFEKEFSPRIFPLVSLNGGGKSTLLQLIFILLHCSADPEKHEFIRNLLAHFDVPKHSEQRTIAKFEIWDGTKAVSLEFFVCQGFYLGALLFFEKNLEEEDINDNSFTFRDWLEIKQQQTPILDYPDNLDEEETEKKSQNIPRLDLPTKYFLSRQFVQNKMREEKRFSQSFAEYDKQIKKLISENNLKLIYDYCVSENGSILYLNLMCRIDSSDRIDDFLAAISQKIFLAAPSTQVFLFLNPNYRKLLFKQDQKTKNYYFRIQEAKSKLVNFYPYDNISIDVLIDSFKQARDKDFEEAIETRHYGNHYQNLLDDFNEFLRDKKINLDKDLSGVNFKAERNGEIIELYPEDLSHGELKRLSLYVWLKHSNIENAIILFDEIEIALHPDWQYQIIRDLEEWGPTNQYILATHSYELCQALTPAHVKEIEPKLLNNVNHS
ncbi:MAG: AAA family ATPase [Woronichinia naegeliana WA131]|uniref:AAA family ATPase n=1 Tax=Woronichinia naegeliana WA131 TaxID=2824559 RepID=A0A977L4J1_9CYAN|nr:MAG: AAA family ATPase [Woronichinia naegeliana WA131]